MTNIDQFESVFKAADKPVFHHEAIDVERVMIVIDEGAEAMKLFRSRMERVLRALLRQTSPEWIEVKRDDFADLNSLLKLIDERKPSMICTCRNLHVLAEEHPYSLGTYVDVLTQVINVPVFLMPREITGSDSDRDWSDTNAVMAITDHMAGEDRLVSYAAQLVEPNGKLFLTHVEDEAVFERYMTAIGKIPAIDTDVARAEILERLLKDPRDYITSCSSVLQQQALPLEVVPVVTLGHVMGDHRRLIEEHQIDLLVMNTKDDDQMAIHGLAYPLTIELRDTPLLLL